MPGPKPCTFNQAFERVLLDRTGVAATKGKYVKEHMDEELKMAHKLDGFASKEGKAEPIGADSIAETGRKPWSKDAGELERLVRLLGPRSPNLASEAFLKPFFRDLNLSGTSICQLDPGIAAFSQLTCLDISCSLLTQISALPPNLQILHAYSSNISRVTCGKTPSLKFLGLGHSRMDERGLEQAAKRFKNLVSLDVSYAAVTDLEKASELMRPMQNLAQLCFMGNPASLVPHYRLRTVSRFPRLRTLDGLAVSDEDKVDAQLPIQGPPLARVAALSVVAPPGDGDGAVAEAAEPEGGGTAAPDNDEPVPLRPGAVRLTVQPLKLSGVRTLLQCFVAELAARKKALEPEQFEQIEQFEASQPADAIPDKVAEACAGSTLRIKFELPDGTWVESGELVLDPEASPPEGDEGAFDSFDLFGLKSSGGDYLSYLLDIAEGAEEGMHLLSLRNLHRWLKEGMHLKVFCRPPVPQTDEALREALAAAAEAASSPRPNSREKGKKPDKAAAKKEVKKDSKKAPGAEEPNPDEEGVPPPERPPERPIGGVVVPLDALMQPSKVAIGPTARETGEVPYLPAPWQHEVSGARVVPMDRFLDPEVQVPIGSSGEKRRAGCVAVTTTSPGADAAGVVTSYPAPGAAGASLQIRVTLFAGDPAEECKPADVVVEDPKAKKKGKK